MTPPTEIKELEEALQRFEPYPMGVKHPQQSHDRDTITKASAAYLLLLKGDMVMVPRKLTDGMLKAIDDSQDLPEYPMNELDIEDYRKSHKAMIKAHEKENKNAIRDI